MKFEHPFLQLPRRYCAETMAAEIAALGSAAWVPHPGRLPGNDAVLLITPSGVLTNEFTGPMKPTEWLLRCPYIMEVMADLGGVWGRSRLMGLTPGAEVPAHVDLDYYWRTHIRIHIPVVTNEQVQFTCDSETIHMEAGDCWIFDSFRPHRVRNGGKDKRVHLVLDTVGGERFWKAVDEASEGAPIPAKAMRPGTISSDSLEYETINAPTVMSPWEMRCHGRYLMDHVASASSNLPAIRDCFDRLTDQWMAVWTAEGGSEDAIPRYRALLSSVQASLAGLGAGTVMLTNHAPLDRALNDSIFKYAVPAVTSPINTQGMSRLQRLAS